jgi:hypothetical protein
LLPADRERIKKQSAAELERLQGVLEAIKHPKPPKSVGEHLEDIGKHRLKPSRMLMSPNTLNDLYQWEDSQQELKDE